MPRLAGGSLHDRFVACLGALAGIWITGLICAGLTHGAGLWLIAPVGASAVLLFGVPASPLAQPWAIIGGNTLSALIGLAAGRIVHDPQLAAALAVSVAIMAMSFLRCLHPPGGAVALMTALGGPAIAGLGYAFALAPVGLNSLILVAAGWLFHRYSGHSYPHRAVPVTGHLLPPDSPAGLLIEDIDRALHELGETFDVSREDLDLLFRRAEAHALTRQNAAKPARPEPKP